MQFKISVSKNAIHRVFSHPTKMPLQSVVSQVLNQLNRFTGNSINFSYSHIPRPNKDQARALPTKNPEAWKGGLVLTRKAMARRRARCGAGASRRPRRRGAAAAPPPGRSRRSPLPPPSQHTKHALVSTSCSCCVCVGMVAACGSKKDGVFGAEWSI